MDVNSLRCDRAGQLVLTTHSGLLMLLTLSSSNINQFARTTLAQKVQSLRESWNIYDGIRSPRVGRLERIDHNITPDNLLSLHGPTLKQDATKDDPLHLTRTRNLS